MPVPDIFASFANPVPVTSSAPLCAVLIDAEEDFDWLRPV